VFIIGGGPARAGCRDLHARERGFDVVVADGAEPPIDKGLAAKGLLYRMPLEVSPARLWYRDPLLGPIRSTRHSLFLMPSLRVDAHFSSRTGHRASAAAVLHERMVERARKVGVTFALENASCQGFSPAGVITDRQTVAAPLDYRC